MSLHRFDRLIKSLSYDAVRCFKSLALFANGCFNGCRHLVHTVVYARREPATPSSFETTVVTPNTYTLTITSQLSVKTSALHLRCCSEVALTC